ncbi:photosystem II D1 precursor processing protein PSB27-H2, chloroplastic isoform X1 [Nymphaea colorata]|nr:photosystem II D1 precursor processing protein PSB27-H2, chloroplastic isoform X1 [Nymphaea colorata]
MASTIGFSSSIFRYSHSLSFSSTLHYSAGKRNSRRSILAFFGDNAAEKSRGTARLAMQWGINTTLRNLMKRERRGCKNCRNGAPARGADEADEEELEVLQWRLQPSLPYSCFSHRRLFLLSGSILATSGLTALGVLAEEQESNDGDNNGIFETITSFLDPNETTKSGKILPKSYLKSAREVVKTLRESLKEESTDMAKFRKSADAAKESIREYLGGWQGKESVAKEESYVALEKAIRSLATFYSKAGPFATLPEEIKHQILDELNKAEAFL